PLAVSCRLPYTTRFRPSSSQCQDLIAMLSKNDPPAEKKEAVVIKKYATRRLYNTETSTYVTLEDLAAMVRSDRDFVVYDAKTGEDRKSTRLNSSHVKMS